MSAESITQQADRFQLAVDGKPAGFAQFVDHDERRVFFHTEVDSAFEGRGYAAALVRAALDATRAEELKIVAVCPYVKKFVEQHGEWADSVVEIRPADLATIPRQDS